MNFSKKLLRVVSCVLMVLILIPAMPSFAATFSDVNSSHWAYSYIEKMASKGYIKGDPVGTFRPEGSLTYLETLSFVSRLIKVNETEKQAMKQKYQTTVILNGVPEWAQEAVMISLLKGVITEDELTFAESKDMIKTGTTKRVGRLTTSIYLAKAMGLDKIEVNVPIGQLYKDLEPEHEVYKELLYLLINAGVLSAEGMGNYNFQPLGFVTRAQMAKMLSTAYDYLEKQVVDTEVISGVITKITKLGTNTFLTVKSNNNVEAAYLVDSTTTIKLDNKIVTLSSIYEGQDIKVTLKKGSNNALSIEAKTIEEEIKGTLKSITPVYNELVVEYIKDKITKTAELAVDAKADITLNGEDADLYDLTVGDEVTLFTENNLVLEIEAIAKSGEVEGEIEDLYTEIESRMTVNYITIESSKGVKTEYKIDEDADISRDGRRSVFGDLRLGDMAYIELEYGLVVDIDAEIVEKEIEGAITAISTRLNSGTEITIKDRVTNEEETYALARNVYIKVDDVVTNSYGLNVGYFVEAVIGSNEIIELYADSVSAESMIRGKITDINTRRKEIDLDVMNSEISEFKYGDNITIKIDSNVEITDGYYDDLEISDLDEDMTILIFGFYDGYSFIANEINIR